MQYVVLEEFSFICAGFWNKWLPDYLILTLTVMSCNCSPRTQQGWLMCNTVTSACQVWRCGSCLLYASGFCVTSLSGARFLRALWRVLCERERVCALL